jgi:hypothetical protein
LPTVDPRDIVELVAVIYENPGTALVSQRRWIREAVITAESLTDLAIERVERFCGLGVDRHDIDTTVSKSRA